MARVGEHENDCIENILNRYSWREYTYKYGRWQYVQRLWAFYPEFSRRMRWARVFDTFQLLDLESAQPVGEMIAVRRAIPKISGVLRFAGDPRIAGVYSHLDGKSADARFTHSRFIDKTSALKIARSMRPGDLPDPDILRHNQQLGQDDRGPWIVDHPKRPRTKR